MPDISLTSEELEKYARALSVEEKAALARILIEELDTAVDRNAEQLWLEEAHVVITALSEEKLTRSLAMR